MRRSSRGRMTRTSLLLLGAAITYPFATFAQTDPPKPDSAPGEAPASPAPPKAGAPDAEGDDGEVIDVETAPLPVPKDKGVILGTVVESANGEPIIEAIVTVNGTKWKALTDLDGNYRLELPPGVYDLRVFYEGHKPRRIQKATVAKGQTLRVDVSLEPESAEPEPVREITVTADRTSAATQVLIRKSAANVGDAVSAQDIAKTPDRNAAEAAKRVVGAAIVDGRFVFVRGLGERYTNALLNGSPLPSPEPDRQAVPLDLFPSLVLSDIAIVKTFTPDMPGDFAGGSVSIHTRQPTETFQISATATLGVNTESTFQERLSYQGGSLDFLGIDSGRRSLPKGFPTYKLVSGLDKPGGGKVTDEEVWAAGRRINSSMATDRSTAPPNHGLSVVASGTLPAGPLGKVGATAALTYSRRFSIVREAIFRQFYHYQDPEAPDSPFPFRAQVDNKGEIGNDQVSWGGLAVVSVSPSDAHRVTATALVSRSSDNEARILTGYNEGADADLEDTRLRFLSRGLFFGELSGEHKLRSLHGLELGYRVSGSLATLDEPDTRQTSYQLFEQQDGTIGRFWNATPTLSGQHFFGTQVEKALGGSADVTLPILEGKLPLKAKAGGLFQLRERSFDVRRFHFRQEPVPFTEYVRPADEIFTDDNIGPVVGFQEWTQATDSYSAQTRLFAGYLMADFSPVGWLRLIGGARVEAWSMDLSSFDRFLPDTQVTAKKDSLEVLPALSLVLKTTKDSNLRASISRTVSRPQLREIAPFLFSDFVGSRDLVGNPELLPSSILNADLRFEVFPGAGDVAAVSAFYKQFTDPIETVIQGGTSSGLQTFDNADAARVLGIELELKKGLGAITSALSDLSVIGNVTLSHSRVDLSGSEGVQTSKVRPLVGQSPLVVNLGLDYANDTTGTRGRVVYNVAAPRIQAVGQNELLDQYEQPRHLLDVAIAQRIGKYLDLKLTVENILAAPYRVTFGEKNEDERVVEERRPGTTFNLSATILH